MPGKPLKIQFNYTLIRRASSEESTDAKLDVARSLAFEMEENELQEGKFSYLNYTLL